MVDVVVALAGAVDAVGPVQAGVEPLRAVRRGHLHGQHVAVLVVEGAGVVLAGEVAALPAPVGPGAGQAVEHLAGVGLAAGALLLGQLGEARARRGRSATARTGPASLRVRFRRAGTPALRKYFCARMSAATWLQCSGTAKLSSRKTTEPSGFLISDVARRNGIFS